MKHVQITFIIYRHLFQRAGAAYYFEIRASIEKNDVFGLNMYFCSRDVSQQL